ncbi:DUF3347 domain-containing protein [Opitutus terrae]|uniref:DUF3347 domain-containing protein n=1 Tax=Opitutus terrae (strain DSM 11246 / JCM 15787 / PB90-1) TaxID=452637 RepID=B1ZPX1_OPITP|nr:DUF3347 domain-containing protein [Opitutus terrae]ACB77692.1 hypothetical protein Oter_4421 [Opitutus terrae PB90-1]
MKTIRILILVAIPFVGAGVSLHAGHGSMPAMAGHEHRADASSLSDAQKQYLVSYDAVRAALAADDLAGAKSAAADLPDSPAAKRLVRADSLNTARVAFKKLSEVAVQVAKGHDGYFVFNCPMVGSDWVQTTKTASNPYVGQKMPTCGVLKD